MAGEPITREEMVAMFGEAMPMEAVQLAWSADDTKTIGEIRDELRALAKRTKARRDDGDIVDLLKMAARNGNALAGEAADEIERLRRAENDAAEWVKERTKRLRSDNERLRAALLDIANMPTTHDGERIFGDIARAALEGK